MWSTAGTRAVLLAAALLFTANAAQLSYWGFANPILYYEERYLEPSAATAAAAVTAAQARSRWLFADRDRVAGIEALAEVCPVFTLGDGVLLDVR